MRHKVEKLVFLASILGVVGAFSYLYFFPPAFLCVQEMAVLTPLQHLSELDLIRLSGVKKGDNLFQLKLSQVRDNMKRFPWIRDVQLSKRIPGRLLIWVQEQEPVALAEVGEEGALYLVNQDGFVFKKVEAKDPKDFPILSGFSADLPPQELNSLVGRLVSLMKLFDRSSILRMTGISEIHWDQKGGVSIFTKDPVVRVQLGLEEKEWNEELDHLSQAWETIHATAKRPKVVDLNFSRRIVVKQEL